MEASLVERGRGHVNKVGHMRRVGAKKRKQLYRRFRGAATSNASNNTLQQLFDSCKQAFKGPGTVPSPEEVQGLRHILDNMKPEDVGLSEDIPFFKPGNVAKEKRVVYTTVSKHTNFSLCIFFIPEGGVIPLHNHPGMTVFSKILLGQMHVKSYDFVDSAASDNLSQQPSKVRLAKLKADKVFTASCDTSVLYPTTGGNIHEFTAVTPCAVLDVIGPPYSKEDDRDCSYYKDHPYASFPNEKTAEMKEEKDSYAWLEEIEVPENSEMDGIAYMGPAPV